VFAVRGCPVDCDFCSVTRLFGPRFRTRPIPDVVAEIDSFRNYYYLLDDSVFGRPPVYDYYLELYEAVAGLKKKRYWTGQANLHAAGNPKGRRVIEKAVEAGLLYAAVGMESINPATLERCGAIAKAGAGGAADVVAAMKDNIRFMQDLGIIVSGWFVLGYEDDTIDTYYETIEFCREMNILPAVFPVKALPGTRLHERLKAAGRLDDTRLVNVLHPTIKDEEIFAAMEYMRKEGYSLKENLKRARHYFPRFGDDRIHKTIFLMVLQSRLKVGLDVSRDEFYVDPDLEE
jgi:radical SAM superfamily enzyme YgiQ (UPF0313 family)